MMRRAQLNRALSEIARFEEHHISHTEAETQRGAVNRVPFIAKVAAGAGGIIKSETDSRHRANDPAWMQNPRMVGVIKITVGCVRSLWKTGNGRVGFQPTE